MTKAKTKKTSGSKTKYADDFLMDMYRKMKFWRRFEERVNQAYTSGKFSGFCHLYIGQEAVGVGVQECLRESDYMISGYRSHTQAIGKGIKPEAVMSELFGRVDGCVGGKGGSMHMFSKEHNFLGGHGIVGGQVPIATGVGFAIRYNSRDDICVCYLGDAAQNQGQFYESLNMAAAWDLPVLYIIENNRYGMGTDIKRVTSIDHLYKRALAFDMDHSAVDGMNVLTVHEHTKKIVEKMRKDKRPHLLEANTYRYRGHSVSDPAHYRTKEELKSFQEKDPILQIEQMILDRKMATAEELKAMDKELKAKIKEVEAFAEASELPDVSAAWEHVYK